MQRSKRSIHSRPEGATDSLMNSTRANGSTTCTSAPAVQECLGPEDVGAACQRAVRVARHVAPHDLVDARRDGQLRCCRKAGWFLSPDPVTAEVNDAGAGQCSPVCSDRCPALHRSTEADGGWSRAPHSRARAASPRARARGRRSSHHRARAAPPPRWQRPSTTARHWSRGRRQRCLLAGELALDRPRSATSWPR